MATKVTFQLDAQIVSEATSGLLLGDFNNWDISNAVTLKKQKDGSLKTSLELESGKTYQYRYLLNDGRWVNDSTATQYNFDNIFQVENCVVTVPEVVVKNVLVKTPVVAKPKAAPVKKTAAPVKKAKVAIEKIEAPKVETSITPVVAKKTKSIAKAKITKTEAIVVAPKVAITKAKK
jgi:hypothetical protein